MDEGTSHLDLEAEAQINANLKALAMTRIVIAHRPDTLAAADRVVRLGDDGPTSWSSPPKRSVENTPDPNAET
jgi:ABC-type bacteriocin/lantibiotic exporter with double-glycine peptidase domain